MIRYNTCYRCKRKKNVDDMVLKLKDDKYLLLCLDCSSNNKAKSSPSNKPSIIKNDSPSAFLCTKCRYKFSKNEKSDSLIKCPWCGKDDFVVRSNFKPN